MAEYSVGEALKRLMAEAGWGAKLQEYRIKEDWEAIAGSTIARYTSNIQLRNKVLVLSTDVAPLKHEIMLNKQNLIEKINLHFGERMVNDIQVR